MGKEMAQIDWKDILSKDVETDWQSFKGILLNLCEKHIPKKTIKEMKRPPWLKQEVLRLVRQKRASWRRYKISSHAEDFQAFKLLEKKVKKAVGKAKHKYEVHVANNAKTNPKMFYSYLNKKKPI